MAVTVGYAEIYTGRHYFSDAVAGAGIGTAVGALANRLPVPVTGGASAMYAQGHR